MRHAPFGKNLLFARVWETECAITLDAYLIVSPFLQLGHISARTFFRSPNRAEVFPSSANVAVA